MTTYFVYPLDCGEKPDPEIQKSYNLRPYETFEQMTHSERADYAKCLICEQTTDIDTFFIDDNNNPATIKL